MTNPKKPPLRSAAWFGAQDKNGFMYRSWMKNQGIPDHEFRGKPVIGIAAGSMTLFGGAVFAFMGCACRAKVVVLQALQISDDDPEGGAA